MQCKVNMKVKYVQVLNNNLDIVTIYIYFLRQNKPETLNIFWRKRLVFL